MKIGKHRRMPVYLLPVVSNLTEAAVRVSQCEDVSAVRKGMLDDVKALGRILQEVLPYLDSYDLHVSLMCAFVSYVWVVFICNILDTVQLCNNI